MSFASLRDRSDEHLSASKRLLLLVLKGITKHCLDMSTATGTGAKLFWVNADGDSAKITFCCCRIPARTKSSQTVRALEFLTSCCWRVAMLDNATTTMIVVSGLDGPPFLALNCIVDSRWPSCNLRATDLLCSLISFVSIPLFRSCLTPSTFCNQLVTKSMMCGKDISGAW